MTDALATDADKSHTIRLFSTSQLGRLSGWLVMALLFGYPVVAVVCILLGVDTNVPSISYRAVCLFLSMYLIVGALWKTQWNPRINVGVMFFLLFWVLYSLRLFYDLYIVQIPLVGRFESHFYIFSYAYGSAFFPALAIALNGRLIDWHKYTHPIFGLLLLINLGILLIVLRLGGLGSLLVYRLQLGEENNLNAITISLMGTQLVGISLVHLLIMRKLKLQYLLAVLLGIGSVLLGASRSGLLITVLLALFVVVVRLKQQKVSFWKTLLVIALLLSSMVWWLSTFVDSSEIALFQRLTGTLQNQQVGAKEARDFIWENAFNQFLNSPVVGDQLFERETGYYPHNIFIEVLMSIGLVGFVGFGGLVIFLGKQFNRIYTQLNSSPYLIVLLVLWIVQFTLVQTSGGIFVSPEFWITSMALAVYFKPSVTS